MLHYTYRWIILGPIEIRPGNFLRTKSGFVRIDIHAASDPARRCNQEVSDRRSGNPRACWHSPGHQFRRVGVDFRPFGMREVYPALDFGSARFTQRRWLLAQREAG